MYLHTIGWEVIEKVLYLLFSFKNKTLEPFNILSYYATLLLLSLESSDVSFSVGASKTSRILMKRTSIVLMVMVQVATASRVVTRDHTESGLPVNR